jgi:hypothetical protein
MPDEQPVMRIDLADMAQLSGWVCARGISDCRFSIHIRRVNEVFSAFWVEMESSFPNYVLWHRPFIGLSVGDRMTRILNIIVLIGLAGVFYFQSNPRAQV